MATRRVKKRKFVPPKPPVDDSVAEKVLEKPKDIQPKGSLVDLTESWTYERQWKKKKEIPPEIPDEAA